MTLATIAFVERNSACFERSLLAGESTPGHITGSAWVVSTDRQSVLLIHHRKLDRWLQPGGHADGNPNVATVALREAQEETGLHSLRLVMGLGGQPSIFDVDVHGIPALGNVPEHLHYDIRFLAEAEVNEPFGNSDEVKNSQWFTLESLKLYTDSESILRMVRKSSIN